MGQQEEGNARDLMIHARMAPKNGVTGRQPEAGTAEHPMDARYCCACCERDVGMIPSKSGNFMLVPLSNEGKCTLKTPKKRCVQQICEARSLWALTDQ